MEKCEKCGNTKITYYKQVIKGGRVVVTARCENGHHPKNGKAFYPLYNFHLDQLPILPEREQPTTYRNQPLFGDIK